MKCVTRRVIIMGDLNKDGRTKTGTSFKSEACKRCGDSGLKTVKCPDQGCGVCGGKGHAPEICDNAVSVFACQTTEEEMILRGEEEAYICYTPGKLLGAPVPNREGLVRK